MLIGESLGLERPGERIDQHARHLQLLLRWRRPGFGHPELRGQHLVGVDHRGQQHHFLAVRPDRGEVPPLAQRDPGDGHAITFEHRVAQQLEGRDRASVRRDVVARIEVDGVDRRGLHELLDIDGPASLRRQRLHLFAREAHVLSGRDLEAFADLLIGNLGGGLDLRRRARRPLER